MIYHPYGHHGEKIQVTKRLSFKKRYSYFDTKNRCNKCNNLRRSVYARDVYYVNDEGERVQSSYEGTVKRAFVPLALFCPQCKTFELLDAEECKHENAKKGGLTPNGKAQRYQCLDCGKWFQKPE